MMKKILKLIGKEILFQILETFQAVCVSKILQHRSNMDAVTREKLVDAINSIDVNDFIKNV